MQVSPTVLALIGFLCGFGVAMLLTAQRYFAVIKEYSELAGAVVVILDRILQYWEAQLTQPSTQEGEPQDE